MSITSKLADAGLRVIAAVHVALTTFVALVAPAPVAVTTGELRTARTKTRGATLIEYVLLAALAVFLFFVIRMAFSDAFDTILCRVRNALGGAASDSSSC